MMQTQLVEFTVFGQYGEALLDRAVIASVFLYQNEVSERQISPPATKLPI